MERGYSTHSRNMMADTLEKADQPVLTQLKKAYWTTKQQIRKTIGKKEDEHVTASDAELDAKLELFKQIQLSCIDLLKVILAYQKRLVILAREENAMGKFLKTNGEADATQAGKMMTAVGKSQTFSAQQRIKIRQPLFRLFQEVHTFRTQAIVDTQITVGKMEEARTEYRGALLWMKDVSERLNPEEYNRLEKFRKVQIQVRKAKELFDKHKLDVLQKVDLLTASRSNMFSHALSTYQDSLLVFWKKTSKTMNAVSETFKGFQYYEFNMLKNDLDETTKELARETASERTTELLQSLLQDTGETPESEEDRLIYDIIMSLQDKHEATQKTLIKSDKDESKEKRRPRHGSADSTSGLIDFDDEDLEAEDARVDEQFGDFQAAIDKESKDLGLLGSDSAADKYSALRQVDDELLDDIFGPEQPLITPGLEDLPLQSNYGQDATTTHNGGFLPSDLLDLNLSTLNLQGNTGSGSNTTDLLSDMMSLQATPQPVPTYNAPAPGSTAQTARPTPSATQDPDSIGKQGGADFNDGCV